ncbi:Bug family tripartite tricarboxylate transporter substrate binding protein [Parapusillimonas granuli]|uniref:Tripartite tricarboxylate transporter substrate binding protein n=1 Tax=Parapusillimonas granuli TaxID=380911 RepID=A0A853G8H7_9BURK|nr:tripartite tricarboxylate transporter substrate binding protein [Parapusillimonas granuli]MBB5217277.1 tripartite-type tricarboxylate transporter receptor subunit TctC [Parapusillimonas granuli]NYT50931.1 tripartite tricarboxylate transporter substrate binding protein [Parapusillimonas granuli]
MMHFRKFAAISMMALGVLASTPAARAAEAYPTQVLKLLVPFPPGGGTDTMARFVANALTEKFNWNVIVDNRPGAGGTVGLGMLARSPANGYNMALGQTSNLSINPYLYSNISYDVAKDFAPVVSVASQPMVLIVAAGKPYKNVQELVDFAKAHPGRLTVGNAGTGTVGDITGRFFAHEAGIDVLHVPYKGAAPAMNDLLGGQIDAFFASTPAVMAQQENPKIRALAITTLKPIPQLPNVPPLAETLPGFEAASKTGLIMPAGTPKDIIETVNRAVNEVLKTDKLRTSIMEEGNVVLGGSVREFADLIADDSAKWSKIISDANIQIK